MLHFIFLVIFSLKVLFWVRVYNGKMFYLAIARYQREYLTTRSVTPWWKFPFPPWCPLASCCGAVRGQQEDTHVHKRMCAHTLSIPTAKKESTSTMCRDTVQRWVWTAETQIYSFASLANFFHKCECFVTQLSCLWLDSQAFAFDRPFVLFRRSCTNVLPCRLWIHLIVFFVVLDHRPQAAAGWVPENCAGARGGAGTATAWLWQKAAAGQVQNWKCTGENPVVQIRAGPMAAWTKPDFT